MTYEMLNCTIFTVFVDWPLSPLFVVAFVDILFIGYMIYLKKNLYKMIVEKEQLFMPLYYILIVMLFGSIIIIINMAVLATLYEYIRTGLELKLME